MEEFFAIAILLYMVANAVALILLISSDYGEDDGFRVKDIIFMIIFLPVTIVAFLSWVTSLIGEKIVKMYHSEKMKPLKNLLNKRII